MIGREIHSFEFLIGRETQSKFFSIKKKTGTPMKRPHLHLPRGEISCQNFGRVVVADGILVLGRAKMALFYFVFAFVVCVFLLSGCLRKEIRKVFFCLN